MHIIENPHFVDFYRRPRCKSKRIEKKWRKRAENYRPNMSYYAIHDSVMCHPVAAIVLRRELANIRLTLSGLV